MYHEQCPAYPCYCSTLLFGSLHSVGHGVHCPLSSCKNSLREATQCLCPATRSYLQRSALERAVLRNMCSFQLPLPLPPPASGALPLLQLALQRFTASLAICDTPRAPCAPAPTPTKLPGELEACSRPSRYDIRASGRACPARTRKSSDPVSCR